MFEGTFISVYTYLCFLYFDGGFLSSNSTVGQFYENILLTVDIASFEKQRAFSSLSTRT